jgi:hypothetical protein
MMRESVARSPFQLRIIMDWLSVVGNLASVAGLVVSVYTLYKVASLSATLRRRSSVAQLAELLRKTDETPEERQSIVPTLVREIEHMAKTIRLSEVSRWPFRDRLLKSYLDALEGELNGKRHKGVIRMQLEQIRGEIEIG